MPDPAELRVSDQDRERVVREIREHFAAGRLTDEELSERVQGVYEARTESELRALRADLPRLPATRAERRAELAQRRRDLQRRLAQQSGGVIFAFVICTVIWLATGAQGMFWPAWVALAVVITLVRNGWRLYGPAPELDRVEQELARRESGEDRRRERRGG
jgi:ABC-type siderophore export system fused ATPase/permease subunit